jgi:Leucine-rich repeat (LRR) protein
VPDSLISFTGFFCSLDLGNNFISTLSEFTFRDLNNLRYLFLTNNRVFVIDKRTFRSLPNLLSLVLKGNPLHEVTKFYFHVPSVLNHIDLSECGLTIVPAGLPLSLRYLKMRRNNVTTLTNDAFSDCPDVNIIVLDENRIERIDDGSLSRLRHLQQVWFNTAMCHHFLVDDYVVYMLINDSD